MRQPSNDSPANKEVHPTLSHVRGEFSEIIWLLFLARQYPASSLTAASQSVKRCNVGGGRPRQPYSKIFWVGEGVDGNKQATTTRWACRKFGAACWNLRGGQKQQGEPSCRCSPCKPNQRSGPCQHPCQHRPARAHVLATQICTPGHMRQLHTRRHRHLFMALRGRRRRSVRRIRSSRTPPRYVADLKDKRRWSHTMGTRLGITEYVVSRLSTVQPVAANGGNVIAPPQKYCPFCAPQESGMGEHRMDRAWRRPPPAAPASHSSRVLCTLSAYSEAWEKCLNTAREIKDLWRLRPAMCPALS